MKITKIAIAIFYILLLVNTSGYAENYKGSLNNTKSTESLAAGCVPGASSTELDLNNVRALIHTGGDMWWDLQGKAQYEVPKGSGKTALFAGAIWIGGKDINDQLKISAQRFRAGGVDYWPGPLIASGADRGTTTSDVCLMYDQHYVITRQEVEQFRTWFNADAATRASDFPGYSVPSSIINWPAHPYGGLAPGYDYYLAPFFDNPPENGIYDPADGDYPYYDLDGALPCGTTREARVPRLFGDQTLWWVYNDRGNIHTESQGDAIGMEIRGQAFAFSTNDELNNMTFYNYALINRSTYTLYGTYFGVWTDADMGEATDDFVGCDVNRGLGYLYNGEAIDGTGQLWAYGGPTPPPPAIGIDFFEGPYQDPDGLDNPSNWEEINGNPELNCNKADINNGNINGLNFEDGIPDNERWGMRRFIYYNNATGNMGEPSSAYGYYNYLLGIWNDGTPLCYGGTGHPSGGGDVDLPTDFMFPGSSDECGWGTGSIQPTWDEFTENNPSGDRRLIQSAGPFTLEPGAVNDITTGAVWAQANGGEPFASVGEVQKADDKAQLLFDNCFKVVNGPDAPDLKIIEMDRELVFHIFNKAGNNHYEDYEELDFTIPNPGVDKYYRFEGYQVFQLKNSEVSVSDLHDVDKARIVFQCDIKNGIGQIVNFYWSDELKANVPVEEVSGNDADKGITHFFSLKEDAFAQGDKRLVNHKDYYFLALAYGYNNFKKYDQNDGNSIDGQKKPYKASRKGADGPIKTYKAIPHYTDNLNNGTIIQSTFGLGPDITVLDGRGGGSNILELTEETKTEIMAGEPWKATNRTYVGGNTPIKVQVIDPLNVPDGEYGISFHPDSTIYNSGGATSFKYFMVENARWFLYQISGTGTMDTIWSDTWIKINNEQIIPELGIAVDIDYTDIPGSASLEGLGVLASGIAYSNVAEPWLNFVPDGDDENSLNWIRSGTFTDNENLGWDDYFIENQLFDEEEDFEKIIGGTWAPYKLAAEDYYNPGKNPAVQYGVANVTGHDNIDWKNYRLSSVDVVFTSDKSKWTRCPVIETSENDTTSAGNQIPALEAVGGAMKFQLRKSPSVNKDGVAANAGSGSSTNPDDPNFIGETGMGWFPGYVIDIETGERLNIMFGEASELSGENGADMKWNPSPNYFSKLGTPIFGGRHYIYVLGHNFGLKVNMVDTARYMPAYDYGKQAWKWLVSTSTLDNQKVYKNCMWVSIPVLNFQYANLNFNDVIKKSDVTVSIRMAGPYYVNSGDFRNASAFNKDIPAWKFSTADLHTIKNDKETAKNALDKIKVVPNPYYGYSQYERNQLDNLVKITNLPQKCTISIYNVSGTLVRRFKKDSEMTYQEWDLKNQYGIPVASGVYILHIKADGLGEKILKWFGAMRPIDLNAF
jgi:hypothetical protein